MELQVGRSGLDWGCGSHVAGSRPFCSWWVPQCLERWGCELKAVYEVCVLAVPMCSRRSG
jgi:hypothetical protein